MYDRVEKKVAIYTPTAFSPNNDGINDTFTLFAKESAVAQINYLRIFNRWGNLVFEQNYFAPNQLDLGWDGTFKGEHLNPGLFVWVAEVVYVDGRRQVLEDGVQLVR
ncbi:MAG TPA: gliding motility-associated C-terminal domain-containing protein [Bacteroidetes bacterium]|nr:gliding motility-associated C-terminal domain-containing protein [Bacteroidota bacterium]